jgi:hypothetical protein
VVSGRTSGREAVALQGFDVPGHPLPYPLFNALKPAQDGAGFILVVERGKRGYEDAATVDETASPVAYWT